MKKRILILSFLLIILAFTNVFAQAPANDNCANAITLVVDAPCISGTNRNATMQTGEVAGARCWANNPNNTVWYTFKTGAAGSYIISTDNGTYTDTEIKLYSGNCPGSNPAEVGCSEDDGIYETLAGVITANLLANTDYLVQVDVYDDPTSTDPYDNFCISVKTNPTITDQPLTNDCISGAIDLTSQIYGLNASVPFLCKKFDFKNSVSAPTREIVNLDNIPCYSGTPSPKYFAIWYKFTISGSAPKTWLDVISYKTSSNKYVAALYKGTPATPTCVGGDTIKGLTYVDCSAGGFWIAPPSTNDVLGGALDVADASVTYPRLDLSTLTSGSYYLRVFQRVNAAASVTTDTVNVCAESSVPVGVGSDRCPNSPNIGFVCGSMPNQNVDTVYANQSNAGTYGNSGNVPVTNEPVTSVGAAGEIKKECLGPFNTNNQFNQNSINNSVIYQFNVNPCATCQAHIEVDMENMFIDGAEVDIPNGLQAQLLNTNLCSGSSSSLVASTYGGKCLSIRPTGDAAVPAGNYSLAIDGFNGCLLKYDLRLIIKYSGLNCTPALKPSARFTVDNASVCVNDSVVTTFTGVTGGNNTQGCDTSFYSWSLDNGTLATGSSAINTKGPLKVKWATPGVKNLSLTIRNRGCISGPYIVPITVNAPPVSTFTLSPSTNACVGDTVLVTYSGLAPATSIYNWNFGGGTAIPGGTSQGPHKVVFSTQGSKTISLSVKSIGCPASPVTSKTINIDPAPESDFIIDKTEICQDDQVTVNFATPISGDDYTWNFDGGTANPGTGSGPHTVKWSTGGTKNISLSLKRNGCNSLVTTKTVKVNELPVASESTHQDMSCYEINDGSTTILGSGGSGSFLYNIDGGSFQTNNTFSNLGKGSYVIGIKDANTGCIGTSITVNIAEPAEIIPVIDSIHNSTCGSSDGEVFANISSGGIAPIQYQIDGGSLQNNGHFTGLAAGNHIVKISDQKGCTNSISVSIKDAGSVPLVLDNKTPVSCYNGQDGSFSVSSPVIDSYTYKVSGQPDNTTGTFTGLAAGTYSVSATNSTGCISVLNDIVITEPNPISAGISKTDPKCIGSSDGTATVDNISGGTGAITHKWSTNPVQTGATATGLSAGTYSDTLTDANQCILIKTITLSNPNPIQIAYTFKDANCGQFDGEISVIGSNGNGAPFEYQLNNGSFQSSGSFTGLDSGIYTVTARDANLCTTSILITINDNPAPTAKASVDASHICNGGSTTLHATTVGGLEYLWSPGASLSDPGSPDPIASPSQTTKYYVTISNAAGCTAVDSVTVTVDPKDLVTFSYDNAAYCKNGSNPSPVIAQGAKGKFSANSANLVFADNDLGTIDLSASSPGNYQITFSSNENCPNDTTVSISIKPLPIANAGGNVDVCSQSSANLGGAAVLGYTYQWTPSDHLDNDKISNPKFTSDNTGSSSINKRYIVTATLDGCTSEDTVDVVMLPVLNALAGTDKTVRCTAKTTLNGSASGGSPTYSYKWKNGPATANYSNVGVGTYILTVTDAKGCQATDTVQVTQAPNDLTVKVNVSKINPCPGDTFTVWAVPAKAVGTVKYTWNDLALSGAGPFVLTAGNSKKVFSVNIKDGNGCIAIDSVIVIPQPSPKASFAYRRTGLGVQFTGTTLNNATAWLWNYGDRSPEESGQIVNHTFLQEDFYDVILIVTNPCGNDTISCRVKVDQTNTTGNSEACGDTTVTGIRQDSRDITSNLTIYPNPTTDNVTLELSNDVILSVQVYDVLGNIIYENKWSNSLANKFLLELEKYASGIYSVQVIGKKYSITQKVELIR